MQMQVPRDNFNNLSRKERRALHDLNKDKVIVRKGADKGSPVIEWDREDYIEDKSYLMKMYMRMSRMILPLS